MGISTLIQYLAALIAVIFVLAPHEFAHAFVAYKCGDPTAKMRGRLTLNPIKHLDIYGFLLCAIAGFGWAKPVPVNPYNFKNFRKGMFFTAVAGVITNYIIAFFGYFLFVLVALYFPDGNGFVSYLNYFFVNLFWDLFIFNLGIFIFNLLPLYPLDGFRVVEALSREINPVQRFLRNYGMYILIVLVLESFLCGVLEDYANLPIARYFDILGYVQWFAINILGYPIRLVWDVIFGLPIPSLFPY